MISATLEVAKPIIMRYKIYSGSFALLSFMLLFSGSNIQAQYRERNARHNENDNHNGSKYERYNNDDRNGKYGIPDYAVPFKPEAPWMRPSPPPSKWHVWMPNEWQWRQGRYVSVPGYWMRPPNKNMRYVPGYWNRTREGWVWRQGHWSKSRGYDKW